METNVYGSDDDDDENENENGGEEKEAQSLSFPEEQDEETVSKAGKRQTDRCCFVGILTSTKLDDRK